MIRLALRNLLARKRRTVLTALAVVVGVAQVTGAFILTDSMNATIDDLFKTGQRGIAVVVTPQGDLQAQDPPSLPQSLERKVAQIDGVRISVGEVFALVSILDKDGNPVSMGPPSFVASKNPAELSSWRLAAGRWAGDGEAVLDKVTADRVGYRIGDRVAIVGATGLKRLTITGLSTFGDSNLAGATVAITTRELAQELGDREGRLDSISVAAEPGVEDAALRRTVAQALAGDSVVVETGEEQATNQAEDLKSQLGFLQPVLLAFGLIALFVGSFVIVNTFSATLAQRSQELALLRALGATRRQVSRSVLIESVLIGVLAGVLGLGAGMLIAPGILEMFKAFGADLPAGGNVIKLRTVLLALIVGPLVTGAAGLLPVRRAAAVPPIQAMRGDTSREGVTRPGKLAWLIGALAAASVVGALTTSGTTAALCVGAGAVLTLVAVAALAPLVLGPILRVLGAPAAAAGQTGRLARLNATRQPRRTATTAGALMVGVALVTFVSVFAAGVSAIAKDAFSDRVRADLGLADSGQMGFPAGATALVGRDQDVTRAVGLSYGGLKARGSDKGLAFTGIEPGLADVYELSWVRGNDRLLSTLGPTDVLVDQAADDPTIATAKVGSVLKLKRTDGSPLDLTVRGIVDEGSTLLGGSVIGSSTLLSGEGARGRQQIALVRLREGADAAGVTRRLARTLKERYPTVDALTKSELEERFVGQINQLVNLIYAFLAFALLVSLLGISTTFTLTVQERRRELGMMRAIGTTRRQIRRLVRIEALLTGLLGGVLGVGVGLAFGALVARLLADDGFRYIVPVSSIITVLVLAALVAAAAATLPARRAGRIDIVQALAVE